MPPRPGINGDPGSVHRNDGPKVLWQLIVSWSHSCGRCAQYDHQISNWWNLPFHHGCNCTQQPIYPGAESLPFVDYRAEIDNLPPDQRGRVVGVNNLLLIDKGLASWDDVVTRGQIRDFRVVVDRLNLKVGTMVKAGVPEGVARRAAAAVRTPARIAAETQQKAIFDRLAATGATPDQVRRGVTGQLARRIGVQGPGGVGRVAIKPPPPPPPRPPVSPVARPKPPKGPTPVKPSQAAQRVAEKARRASIAADPARPIAERIATYDDGGKLDKLKAIREHGSIAEMDQRLEELNRTLADQQKAQRAVERSVKGAGRWTVDHIKTMEKLADESLKTLGDLERTRRARADAIPDMLENLLAYRGSDTSPVVVPLRETHIKHSASAEIARGQRFVDRVVAPNPAKPLRANYMELPANGRAFFRSGTVDIHLPPSAPASTVVHELGHMIEDHWKDVGKLSNEFLSHRVGSEPARALAKVVGPWFDPTEMGREDGFGAAFGDARWYVGKQYEHGSTEILSMGIEKLYNDPAGFATNDPEFCKFILGILDGTFRK